MKKLLVVFGVTLGLLSAGLFGVSAYSARGGGSSCVADDINQFPYGFICGSLSGNPANAPLAVGNAGADATNSGDPSDPGAAFTSDFTGNGPGNNGLFKTISPNQTLHFTTGWDAAGPPKKAGGANANRVLTWVIIDGLPSSLYGGVNEGTGTKTTCPGNYPGSPRRAVYNHRDISGTGVNASPLAYNPSNGQGVEDCGTEGRVIYWETNGSNRSPRFDFWVNSGASNGTKFCVRESISVAFDADTNAPGQSNDLWPGSNVFSGSDQNVVSSHVVKQSVRKCFEVNNIIPEGDINAVGCSLISVRAYDRQPTRLTDFYVDYIDRLGNQIPILGSRSNPITPVDQNYHNYNAPGLPAVFAANGATSFIEYARDIDTGAWVEVDGGSTFSPGCNTGPTYTMTADCHNVYFNNLFDADMTTAGVNFQIEIFQRNADGSKGASARTIIDRGSGSFPYNFIDRYGNVNDDNVNNGWYVETIAQDVWPPPTGGDHAWISPKQTFIVDRPCYVGHCTAISVAAADAVPGTTDGVKAGSKFSLSISFHQDGNPGSTDNLPESIFNGTNQYHLAATYDVAGVYAGHSNIGGAIDNQANFTATIPDIQAPPDIGTMSNITVALDYYGLMRIDGSPCSINIKVYKPYQLTPHASMVNFDSQDPQVLQYATSISDDKPIAEGTGKVNGVPATTERRMYKFGEATNVDGIHTDSGNRFVDKDYGNSAPFTNPYSINAGDIYCAEIHIDHYTGWLGPGDIFADNKDKTQTDCPKVDNKPFFKVNGTSISAGGNYTTTDPATTCKGGGTLASWNNNSGTNPNFGASSQLNAVALSKIVGFASARTTYSNRGANDLSFANTNLPAGPYGNFTNDIYSPHMGGYYKGSGGGETHCLTQLTPDTGATVVGSSTQYPGGAALSVPLNTHPVISVTGDVYIDHNITYAGSGGGWAINPLTSTTNIPSFTLIASGNIYIAPGVTQLDGTFQAGGEIYTCGSAYAPMNHDDLYGSCNNQLVVHGSFIAKKVNLMRTFGSLRDEKPAGGGSQLGLLWVCGGGVCPGFPPLSGYDCTQITESLEPAPHRWDDNYLCVPTTSGVHIAYTESNAAATSAGARLITEGATGWTLPFCTSLDIPGETGGSWDSNWICSNADLQFSWKGGTSSPGSGQNPATRYCTQLVEDSDPDKGGIWNKSKNGTFICEPKAPTGTAPATLTCSHAGVQILSTTCAAEVFDFSPEFYLSRKPSLTPDDNGAIHYESFTSLPPVL